ALFPGRRPAMAAIAQEVQLLASSLQLDGLLDRRPGQLSGGQRQRVALARAMIRKPAAFLMDEPLSNLDAKLRTEVRDELASLHQGLGSTFIYVTHDQSEAMTLSSRVAVMSAGRILQVAAPRELATERRHRVEVPGELRAGEANVHAVDLRRAAPAPTAAPPAATCEA
ncbi:MAG: ATP-binding cassette domain-containing protein, partial [Planctomycetia bacterium]|nr:ATP-binding cassette domain-containing protein [Planctomycetia bacterium]